MEFIKQKLRFLTDSVTIGQTTTPNTLRIITIFLGLATGLGLFCFALAFWTGTWQLFAWGIDLFGIAVVSLFSIRLIRRDRSVLAVWLLLGAATVAAPVAMLWTAGLGLVLGLGIVIGLSQVAIQMLPAKQISWGVTLSVLAGVAVLLLDALGPADRPTVPPEMMTLVPVIVVLFIVILGFFAMRQFTNYTLHTKLVMVFLFVALIPVGLLAYFNTRAMRAELTENANQALFAAASQTAANIDVFINTNLEIISTEGSCRYGRSI